MAVRSWRMLLKALSLAVLTGCELFTTRQPEPPTGPGGGWQFPQDPPRVLQNLSESVGRRSTVDYLRSLASSEVNLPAFQFIADPAAAAKYPERFAEWGLSEETAHIQALFASSNLPLDSLAGLVFTGSLQQLQGDTVWITSGYQLHLGHRRDDAPRDVSGQLEFRLLRGADGGWYIQRWTDQRYGGKACWSDLKVKF